MCSRFELNANSRQVTARFNLLAPPGMPNRAETRPTDSALVIGVGGASLARWGLAVEWDSRPLINARSETLASRPTFRRLLGCRVLIPASAWWEWRAEGTRRIKTKLAPAKSGLFAFAGLLDGECFTMITCAAPTELAEVHERMPVILPPEAEAAWVDPAVPYAEMAPLLRPMAGPFTIEAEAPPSPVQGSLF
ncbi:SOS response-associated peptidase [Paramagnetospirillum kuznetsovii]|uniref:Abasic site processing protein n=1 Tax=Paramagnetospirillum kuznetsovii TaxID=2053833 RepID=A0A364NWP5_9PROT|nr:SOS response-associated peptidase family protein [Paramagnetospirillum kuznetsovii]RAU21519.1 SOS response-associated peptidase [Paramagnetospirillum kuznetsovii]